MLPDFYWTPDVKNIFCYAIIVNPITKMMCCKKIKLYENVTYMMRELDTAAEEYIESFNNSYYYDYNSSPLKPGDCSRMFVTRLRCGAEEYIKCYLMFLKHRFICVNTVPLSRFSMKMEYLN